MSGLFKNTELNQVLTVENRELFVKHVFDEFSNSKFQNIRSLLFTTKYADRTVFKEQIVAYEKVINYLLEENSKEIKYSVDEFILRDLDSDAASIHIDKAIAYLNTHIQERISRYQNIIRISAQMAKMLKAKSNEEQILELFKSGFIADLTKMEDQSQKANILKAVFRMILRILGSEDRKLEYIFSLMGEVKYKKSIKCLYVEETKPVIVRNVAQLLKLLDEYSGNHYFRGHSSCDYKMVPSVFREGLFYFEDNMIKEMMLELPDDFPTTATHYEKILKMQHYGIPTKLLDVTTNPLVALFMAADGDSQLDGEVIMINHESFIECYPSSDKVKILTSIPFLPFSTKIILAYFLDEPAINNQMFNLLAKPLLHEIKHEMPAFESRMEKEDLQKHLFVLGPKRNKRIYAQSGHFIVSPLTLKFFASTPVDFVQNAHEQRVRVIIPAKEKRLILNELKILNICKSSMYPEIEHVAKEIKSQYL